MCKYSEKVNGQKNLMGNVKSMFTGTGYIGLQNVHAVKWSTGMRISHYQTFDILLFLM